MEWHPIETAPRGEIKTIAAGRGYRNVVMPTRVLAPTSDGNVTITYWIEGEERWCMFTKKHPPTHWMPLPAPPQDAG
jgi:hypothetical protein